MNHSVSMCKRHRIANSLELPQPVPQRSAVSSVLIEPAAAHKLHRIVDPAIGQRTDVVNRNDPGMLEPSDDLRFANHAVAQVFRNLGRIQDFDRDEPVEFRILRQIHRAHAAAPELFYKGVLGRTKVRIPDDAPEMVQPIV